VPAQALAPVSVLALECRIRLQVRLRLLPPSPLP
jgi:hypothetical protein